MIFFAIISEFILCNIFAIANDVSNLTFLLYNRYLQRKYFIHVNYDSNLVFLHLYQNVDYLKSKELLIIFVHKLFQNQLIKLVNLFNFFIYIHVCALFLFSTFICYILGAWKNRKRSDRL